MAAQSCCFGIELLALMRVLHVSASDGLGGAGRAAYRIHQAVNGDCTASLMRVVRKVSADPSVLCPRGDTSPIISAFRGRIGALPLLLQQTTNPIYHSPSCLPSWMDRELNAFPVDLLHLHWLQGEMLSIEAIGRLRAPLVWSLHDSWPICGSEHHPQLPFDHRFSEGYNRGNRLTYHRGLDIDRWCWRRKLRSWKLSGSLVSPSSWLAANARQSPLFTRWSVHVIPHPLRLSVFRPYPKQLARDHYGLPRDGLIVLFGAVFASQDPNKGWSLLEPILAKLAVKYSNLSVVVFGSAAAPSANSFFGLPVHFMGRIEDDNAMALLYSAADAMLVPSRVESFGLTASEAHACAVPVVAYRTSGLTDVVDHGITGLLAEPFDPDAFYGATDTILADPHLRERMSEASRQRALRLWDEASVSKQYQNVYLQALDRAKSR
jgi:glycosyltransferase involved in cell wall biosynthesis